MNKKVYTLSEDDLDNLIKNVEDIINNKSFKYGGYLLGSILSQSVSDTIKIFMDEKINLGE